MSNQNEEKSVEVKVNRAKQARSHFKWFVYALNRLRQALPCSNQDEAKILLMNVCQTAPASLCVTSNIHIVLNTVWYDYYDTFRKVKCKYSFDGKQVSILFWTPHTRFLPSGANVIKEFRAMKKSHSVLCQHLIGGARKYTHFHTSAYKDMKPSGVVIYACGVFEK